THLYTGAQMSPLYDPYIGKIVTFSSLRQTTITDMRNFLSNIIIRGIKTNMPFLRNLLQNEALFKGETTIDFLNKKCNFLSRKKTDEEIHIAGALLSAAFHIENRKKNYTEKLSQMKQPGFLKRIFNRK
ncbi:MAG: hypothetical protein GY765_40610, partial [bacterium]|nr:hypothetical protein [bacterium]